jgi:type II secretory pathway pseudopilin PulG
MHRRRHAPGFTLAETLVALVLFVLATSVLAGAINNAIISLETMELKEGHEEDFRFVRSQIFTITDITTFTQGGQVLTPTGGNAQWSATATPTQTADLYQANITINLEAQGGTPAESQIRTYYLLRPSFTQSPDDRTTALSNFHDAVNKTRSAQSWP